MSAFVIPQSTAVVVCFKAYLSSDHVSEATGKTIAITISKNGGAFGNPNAGATNATEIANGWYKVSLDTTDTGTVGPLAIRGSVASIDDVGITYQIVKATNGGWTALPDTAVTTNGSLLTSGTGTAQLSVSSGVAQADVAKIATASVSTSSAQLGVNVVNAAGTAWGSGAITSGVFASGAIDATAIATDAIGSAELSSAAANKIADAMLDRDMSTGTDSGSTTVRTMRQALRFLRNKWTIIAGTLTVYKEDDSTTSWTGSVTTNAAADPVTGNDPAG